MWKIFHSALCQLLKFILLQRISLFFFILLTFSVSYMLTLFIWKFILILNSFQDEHNFICHKMKIVNFSILKASVWKIVAKGTKWYNPKHSNGRRAISGWKCIHAYLHFQIQMHMQIWMSAVNGFLMLNYMKANKIDKQNVIV